MCYALKCRKSRREAGLRECANLEIFGVEVVLIFDEICSVRHVAFCPLFPFCELKKQRTHSSVPWAPFLSMLVIAFPAHVAFLQVAPSFLVACSSCRLSVLRARFLKSAKSSLLVHVLSSFLNVTLLPLFPLPLDWCIYAFLQVFLGHFNRALQGNRYIAVFVLFPSLLWWKLVYLNEGIYAVFMWNQKLSSASKY